MAVLVLGGLLSSGCRSQPRLAKAPSGHTAVGTTPGEEVEVESAANAEKRVEAHTRYATGVLFDLNDETSEATEEFLKAALLDTGNQPLVLEVSRRLFQLKQYDKALELLRKATAPRNASPILFERLALAYASLGKKEQAIEAYRTALKKNSRMITAYRSLAQLYLQDKQYEDALKVLEQAAAQADPSPGFLVDLAELFVRYSRTGSERETLGKERAIAAIQAALKKNPKLMAAYQSLFQLHLQNKDYDEALAVLDQAAAQPEPGVSYLVDLAEMFTRYSRTSPERERPGKQRALDLLNRASALDPASALALQKIADGYNLLGEAQKAIDIYLKLLAQNEDLTGIREKLSELYLRNNDKAHAAEQLEAIARDYPTPRVYYFLGSLAYEGNKLKEAADYFNRSLLLNPEFEPAYYDLAGAQINLDQPREALDTLDKARSKFSKNFLSEFFSGMAYTKLKEFTNATSRFTEAEVIARVSDTNRLNHVFYFQFGAASERSHNYDDAEKYFQKALALKPDFAEALNYLGYMWAERGVKLPQARELIEQAVKLEPDNPAYLDSLGWVLFKLKQTNEALTYLLKAIKLSKEPDPTLFDHLGDIHASLNQSDQAREAWQKSIALEPNPEVKKKLEPPKPVRSNPR